MTSRRTTAAGVAALALAGAVALGGCGAGGSTSATGATSGPSSATPRASSPSAGAAATAPAGCTTPWRSWGPGMMGQGWGSWGPGMMSGGYWLPGTGVPVTTLDQARARASAFAGRLGLRAGEIMQFWCNFYAELKTPAGQLATEVLVDPATGAVEIEYGPAMMWNTDYGMHRGGQGPARITADQARHIAQQWLTDHATALTAGDPESYPGYYTMDTLRDGKITGMLSVNAVTGAVWDHTWHGTYIASSEP